MARRLRLEFLWVKTSEGLLLSSGDVVGVSPGLKERRREDFLDAVREGMTGRFTTGVISARIISGLEGGAALDMFDAGMGWVGLPCSSLESPVGGASPPRWSGASWPTTRALRRAAKEDLMIECLR